MSEMSDRNDCRLRILAAIYNTREFSVEYWQKCLSQRIEETHCGSFYHGFAGADAEWRLEEQLTKQIVVSSPVLLESPRLEGECIAFSIPLEGEVGLAKIRLHTEYCLVDPKQTGFVDCVIHGSRNQYQHAQHTTIILGVHKDKDIVNTFHPGDPIAPSRVPAEGHAGRIITGEEAKALGFSYAKIVEAYSD